MLMARISKPIRHICYPVVAGAIAFFIYRVTFQFIEARAYLFALLAFFWFYKVNSPIDQLDLWLRKHTKDNIWLFTQEGKEWLKTKQGQEWTATRQKETEPHQ